MATDYPTAIDGTSKLPNPTTGGFLNSPSHAGLHGNVQDAVKATQTKLGTGSSTPVANTFLFGTGTGASTWQTLTSAAILAAVSDETGTGNLVFNTTPTLITPKVDTINESTLNNGVTVAGMNVKAGVLSAPSTAIGNNGITAANLATNAITLGYAQITTNFTTTSTTDTQLTGLSVTVTIPAGGRRVKITAAASDYFASTTALYSISLWDGTVGSGSQLSRAFVNNGAVSGFTIPAMTMASVVPVAGSKTYNVGLKTSAGTLTVEAAAAFPAFILVEVI